MGTLKVVGAIRDRDQKKRIQNTVVDIVEFIVYGLI